MAMVQRANSVIINIKTEAMVVHGLACLSVDMVLILLLSVIGALFFMV